MKTIILHLLTLGLISLFSNLIAQPVKIYTINWSTDHFNLVEIDLAANTETVIAALETTKISDFNPETSSYDHLNNRLVFSGWYNGNDRIYSVDITNGNIVYDYTPSFEPTEIEYGNNKTYTLNWSGGHIELTECDLALGTETFIASLDTTKISDYNSESSSYDYQNNRIIIAGWYNGYNRLFAIDVTNGNIIYNYAPSFEPFEIEYGNNKAYSIKWSVDHFELIEFDLVANTEIIVATIDTTIITDFNSEASTFDHLNNRLIVSGWYNGTNRVFSIDVSNGNTTYYNTSFELSIAECNSGTGSSVKERSFDNYMINIYPNPASEFIYIETHDINHNNLTFEISDINGKVLKEGTIFDGEVDISDLDDQLFFIKVKKENEIFVRKIIKD